MKKREITELLGALRYGGEAVKEHAREQLRRAGEAAVEPLCETIEQYIRQHTAIQDEEFVSLSEEKRQWLLTMALLLADYQSPHCLRVLAKVALMRESGGNRGPFLSVVAALEARGSRDDVYELIATLNWLSGRAGETPLSLAVARALVTIAQHHPEHHRDLEMGLSLLRRYNMASFSYLRLHRALKIALSTKTLPIPAQSPRNAASLPIPMESERQ
jgi:hypothetical protein